jgi:hypothetical protein
MLKNLLNWKIWLYCLGIFLVAGVAFLLSESGILSSLSITFKKWLLFSGAGIITLILLLVGIKALGNQPPSEKKSTDAPQATVPKEAETAINPPMPNDDTNFEGTGRSKYVELSLRGAIPPSNAVKGK